MPYKSSKNRLPQYLIISIPKTHFINIIITKAKYYFEFLNKCIDYIRVCVLICKYIIFDEEIIDCIVSYYRIKLL